MSLYFVLNGIKEVLHGLVAPVVPGMLSFFRISIGAYKPCMRVLSTSMLHYENSQPIANLEEN